MPTYNYHCLNCGAVFTARLTYAELDEAQPTCPDCGSARTERRLSNVHLVLGDSEELFRLTREHVQAAAGLSGLAQGQGGDHAHGGGCACGGSCDGNH